MLPDVVVKTRNKKQKKNSLNDAALHFGCYIAFRYTLVAENIILYTAYVDILYHVLGLD